MKKLIVLLLLVVSGIADAAAQSMLKVSLADRSVINVSVDGRYFTKGGQSVTVGDLPPGRHSLQIYAISQDRRGRAREQVIYEGKVRTSSGAITLFVFDEQSGQTDIQDQDMSGYAVNMPQGGNAPGTDMNTGNYNNSQYNNPGNSSTQDNSNYNNNSAPVASPVAMGSLTDDKVSKLKDKIAAKAADTQKMDALKALLKGETYNTDQVGTMMGWFVFEDTKVTFAEWAYNNTVDKDNFKSLENQFSYKNSQDELDKFLQGQK